MSRAVVVFAVAMLAVSLARASDTPELLLYMTGAFADGRKTQPCAGCHALDGGGRSEAGVDAPAINTRTRYDGEGLRKLLRDGITADGRMIDRIMPRVDIELALAQALAQLLPELRARNAAGVESDRIRILVASTGATDPLPEALAKAIDKWSDGGVIYGRRVAVEAATAEQLIAQSSRSFAVVGLVASSQSVTQRIVADGGLNLFPRYPFIGDEDPDRNRGLLPDQPTLGRALASAAGQCREVVLEEEDFRAAEAVGSALRRALKVDAQAAQKCRIALFDRKGRSIGDDERLIAPLDAFASRQETLAQRSAGATLIDVRPNADDKRNDMVRFADAAALTVVRGLIAAGRGLTRSRFLLALDSLSLSPPGWSPLDYRVNRLSGATATAVIDFGAPRPSAR